MVTYSHALDRLLCFRLQLNVHMKISSIGVLLFNGNERRRNCAFEDGVVSQKQASVPVLVPVATFRGAAEDVHSWIHTRNLPLA